ncbi:hypothetical protein ACO1PF_00635 [Alkalibacterium sp. f15]|uniref:hypothetical protein n=1 Tax=Alkalibacterium sp. f15 TaxID=3414029 RepID=UPI003BF796C1
MATQLKEMDQEVFTVKETAAKLRTSPNVIYKLLELGDLRAMKMPDNKIPLFEIKRFVRWAFENEVDYSNILKKKENTNNEKVQMGNNLVGSGNNFNTYR